MEDVYYSEGLYYSLLRAQYRVRDQGSLSGISREQFVTVTLSLRVLRFPLVRFHATNTPCSLICHLRDGQ